ncbi:unnamed protein product [Durusdinium trenchii]|uniref:ABC transporter domain-containing protein n=1 Tax=Durusdinium trenchii TaxID=1381693 RepID=A0ABP0NUA3_9DINO
MEAKHSWLRTPFGDGYRISAQAYRTQLTAEGLRVLLPQGHAVKQSPVSSIATIREDGSFDLTAIAQKLCHDRLRRLVLWEVLAVFLQSLVVLSLGLVLQELEFGLPTWLSLLGEAAEHPAWRSVPFALLIVLARFLQQVAKHRRVKIVEQASSALCAFLFRRATTSGAAAACSVAELLNAVPRLVEATAKGSRLQLAAPMLGLSLGFGLLLMTLGAMAPLLLLLQLLLLGLEVLLRKLTPRWKQEAMHLREQREAMSAAALAMEMGCASATVKLFAWESAVWARLQQLRKREKAALQRLQRLEVLASVARELGVFVPVAVALLLQWLVFGMSLWACFQALAACRMTAQQLRRAQQVLLTKIPQVNACLEQELERTAPKQGDRSTYKSARYAVAIDSMRFFWEEPQEVQALPPKPNGNTALQTVMQKAEKGVSSGLDLVDSVSDDASVAERARRSTNTSNRFDLKVLSLQVKRGSHVALVGATGSGKSTLLAGLVGGCRCEHWGDDREGGVSLSGRLAYAPQRPCVKLADCSIRENVLCGRSFDAQRYEQALTTSTLAEDLQRLSNGDSALVEELAGSALRSTFAVIL